MILFNDNRDIVLNEGMRYINGYIESCGPEKKGLSFAYLKRIVCADGITTKTLNIYI